MFPYPACSGAGDDFPIRKYIENQGVKGFDLDRSDIGSMPRMQGRPR